MSPWKQNAHQERDTNVSLFLPLGFKERFWRKSSVSRQSRVHQLFFRCSRPNSSIMQYMQPSNPLKIFISEYVILFKLYFQFGPVHQPTKLYRMPEVTGFS
jgi:hypothetical protein